VAIITITLSFTPIRGAEPATETPMLKSVNRTPLLVPPPETLIKSASAQTPEADAKKPIAVPANSIPAINGSASANSTANEHAKTSLFENGLNGWIVQEGREESWQETEDGISCVALGGGWLRTERTFSDFIFSVDYRLQAGGNTGIGVRCPDVGNPSFKGIEVQLIDDSAEKYAKLRPDQHTGSIYYQVAPQMPPELNATGEWNHCEIQCLGEQLTVTINGQIVNQLSLSKPDPSIHPQPKRWLLSERPPVGHIALQSHSTRVDFRNAEVQELDVETGSGLQYIDIAQGDGDAVPSNATVTVHYVGQLESGKRFSDSRELGKPVTVPLENVIPGWQEGISGMKVGGKRRLIVPAKLGYGTKGVTNLIPPNATLVFEVELCDFKLNKTAQKPE